MVRKLGWEKIWYVSDSGGGGGGGRRNVSSRGRGCDDAGGSVDSRSLSFCRLDVVKCFQKGGGAGKGAFGSSPSIAQRLSGLDGVVEWTRTLVVFRFRVPRFRMLCRPCMSKGLGLDLLTLALIF